MSIKENIEKIRKTMPPDVTLVAATKTRAIEEIKEALKAGITIIGENYVQEAETKLILKSRAKFHCIGHLQANKIKKAVEIFDMIETVDSLRTAREINQRCEAIHKIMPILIEVNIGKEPSKFGCMPRDAETLAMEIKFLPNLELKGLMAMAPFFSEPEKNRPYFREMKRIFDALKNGHNLAILSMGMSDSYKIAIQEGANMVRIGKLIFGPRK